MEHQVEATITEENHKKKPVPLHLAFVAARARLWSCDNYREASHRYAHVPTTSQKERTRMSEHIERTGALQKYVVAFPPREINRSDASGFYGCTPCRLIVIVPVKALTDPIGL